MPKIKSQPSPLQEFGSRIISNVKLIQGRRTDAEMGKKLGISAATFCRRLQNPHSFTTAEIFLLCKDANVPIDEFVSKNLRIGG